MSLLPPPTGSPVPVDRPYLPPSPPVSAPPDERPPHPTLPLPAGLGALAVLTVSLFASKFVLDALVDFGWPVIVYVALLAAVGYGPSIAWCVVASRRWGTGRFWHDTGVEPRWSDIGWAPVVWLAAVGTQIVVAAFVLTLDIPLSNNTEGIGELSADRTYVVSIVITAVVAAPIVEEIVFRGLVMRSFLGVMPVVAAIALQAVLFGAAHADPVRGAGNIGLVVVLSGVGAAFGGAAYLLRRIGPSILAHAIFNGLVLTLVLTGVQDRLGGDLASRSPVTVPVAEIDAPGPR